MFDVPDLSLDAAVADLDLLLGLICAGLDRVPDDTDYPSHVLPSCVAPPRKEEGLFSTADFHGLIEVDGCETVDLSFLYLRVVVVVWSIQTCRIST